jgi:predicted transcriptional regulator
MSAVDRVQERRRAAALARHYRDNEALSTAEIARRLGRAPATVKAYLYDPAERKDLEAPHRITAHHPVRIAHSPAPLLLPKSLASSTVREGSVKTC